MAKQPVFITGDREIDRKLVGLEKKLHRQVLTKAAKAAGKVVKDEYKDRVPVRTGAMRDAVGVRVRRYKHKEGTGKFRISKSGRSKGRRFEVKRVVAQDIGASVQIDRKRLAKEASKIKRGNRSLPLDRKSGGMFFYPAIVELGRRKKAGRRPLTKSLYENADQLRAVYFGHLRSLLRGV